MSDITVETSPAGPDGWVCVVTLAGTGDRPSRHEVRVTRADLQRYAPGADQPTDLVRRSFAFLLEREPPGSILRSFDLPAIGRYFPEYERDIRA